MLAWTQTTVRLPDLGVTAEKAADFSGYFTASYAVGRSVATFIVPKAAAGSIQT